MSKQFWIFLKDSMLLHVINYCCSLITMDFIFSLFIIYAYICSCYSVKFLENRKNQFLSYVILPIFSSEKCVQKYTSLSTLHCLYRKTIFTSVNHSFFLKVNSWSVINSIYVQMVVWKEIWVVISKYTF